MNRECIEVAQNDNVDPRVALIWLVLQKEADGGGIDAWRMIDQNTSTAKKGLVRLYFAPCHLLEPASALVLAH